MGFNLLVVFNFMLTEGKYNGSTITVLGRNRISQKLREIPVIGGSGVFRFATGYAEVNTVFLDPQTRSTITIFMFHITDEELAECIFALSLCVAHYVSGLIPNGVRHHAKLVGSQSCVKGHQSLSNHITSSVAIGGFRNWVQLRETKKDGCQGQQEEGRHVKFGTSLNHVNPDVLGFWILVRTFGTHRGATVKHTTRPLVNLLTSCLRRETTLTDSHPRLATMTDTNTLQQFQNHIPEIE
ncbi:hypothetical protein JHK85_001610 [Glycine max]|nr:hypothetical protein JHK85_001610 [Glycine max]